LIVAINRQIDGGVNGGANGGVNEGVNDGANDGARKEIMALVKVIIDNEGLKTLDIAAKIGRTIRTTERYLKLARQFGLIEFRGPSKTGGYYITQLIRNRIKDQGE
jgi:ATP-dependent DNA helicase RecG